MAQPGGVLVRAGHTEAGCDLTQLAGLTPAAVICEIINDDGTMARMPDLMAFATQHQLKVGTIADLIQYRSQTESIVQRIAQRTIHTPYGLFQAIVYRDTPSGAAHLALIRGDIHPQRETFVRVHEPLSILDFLETRNSFHSWTLKAAFETIASCDEGIIVLLNCGDSSKRLINGFKALDCAEDIARLKHRPLDFKTYGIGAQILCDLGAGKIRLLADPRKFNSLSGYGLEITGFVPMPKNAPSP
jgi:3,4-dihydroxy 2-butanone 4-phosphate synthase/GTP cyclohydrolase II